MADKHKTKEKEELQQIISKLQIKHGKFDREIPEMLMSINYLKGDEKILEIGGNIGRNSLVMSSILNDDSNLVVMESDENIAKQLIENKYLNNMKFHVEASALSKRKLIQRNWITKPSEKLEKGYHWVNTINLEDLMKKYAIEFDTLVLDCEGAFYYILKDMPELLNNIKLIIMENDYWVDYSHKTYIDNVLKNNNFNRVFVKSGKEVGVLEDNPLCKCFFEVWKRD
jgi:FkbM family methyltransferase